MTQQRSDDAIREDLRRAASTATGFVHDAAVRLAGDFESLLSRLAAVDAWAMKNEIAAPPLDWAGLGAALAGLSLQEEQETQTGGALQRAEDFAGASTDAERIAVLARGLPNGEEQE